MPINCGETRRGFSLAEMMIGVMISGMVLASLASIHSTSTTHLFQNYRQNTIKNGASVAMKTVMTRLSLATRIDNPAFGNSGNILAIAENVDQLTNCRPIRAGEPVAWHYFCRFTNITVSCPSGNCLMYHTGTIAGGTGCPNTVAEPAVPYPAFCGPGGGGTVTKLTDYLNVAASPLFSRRNVPVANPDVAERDTVRVRIRVTWTPSVPLSRSARPVDSQLETTGSIQRSVCNSGLPGCN